MAIDKKLKKFGKSSYYPLQFDTLILKIGSEVTENLAFQPCTKYVEICNDPAVF